jgi:DNA-binding response OmpR family regulator
MRTILLASVDPALTDLKKRLLEAAGYRVIVANTASDIAMPRCLNRKIDLVLIGSSLSREQKRRVWAEYRDQCSSILELYRNGSPELMDDIRTYVHHPVTSVDFVEAVQAVLTQH